MSREERGVGRLGFLKGLAAGTALPLAGGCVRGCEAVRRPVVSLAHEKCRVVSPLVREPVRFVLVGDTHLTVNDGRGDAYLKFTERMGGRRRESGTRAARESARVNKMMQDSITMCSSGESVP